MRQMLLDWGTEKPQTFDTFVAGRNEELLRLLRIQANPGQGRMQAQSLYFWGETGAGKTHLLRAFAAATGAHFISPGAPADAFALAPQVRCYLVDDCDRLSDPEQAAAFHLFNLVRDSGGFWLASGAHPPAVLSLRDDLRSRLAWGLIYQVHGLNDDEMLEALSRSAAARGFALSDEVLHYLIIHQRRDMRSLSALLDALDKYSLETHRPITVPLLRSLLLLECDTE